MGVNLESKIRRFYARPSVQRTNLSVASAFVLGYLAAITYAWYPGLDSPERILRFGFVWTISIIALVLLARAWRSIPWSRE